MARLTRQADDRCHPLELPPPPPGTHYHLCSTPRCYRTLVCAGDDDHCTVIEPWRCEPCEDDMRDAYFSKIAAEAPGEGIEIVGHREEF